MDNIKLSYLRKLAKNSHLNGKTKLANKALAVIAKETGLATPRSDLSYSSIMRDLHKQDPKKMIEFMTVFKEAFDEACKSEGAEEAGQIALMEAVQKVNYKPMEKNASIKDKKILLIGDSLAVGLASRLSELAKKSGVQFKAIPITGTTTFQWITKGGKKACRESLDNSLQSFAPTHVLISLGTNDAYSGYSAQQIEEYSKKLQDIIKSAGAVPMWIGTPSLPARSSGANLNENLVQTIRDSSQKYFDSENISFERADDNIHATPKGYAEWADEIWKWLGGRSIDETRESNSGQKTTNFIPGYKRLKETPGIEIQNKASSILSKIHNKPWGTQIPFEHNGVKYIGVLEEHVGGRVAGPHPGISVFIESSGKQIGYSDKTKKILSGLNPKFKPLVEALLNIATAQGMRPELVSGARTLTEQKRIFEQGRSSPGNIVSDAKPGVSLHNYGLAVDIAALDSGGKVYYPDKNWYSKLSKIAKQLGLWWGGDFKREDIGHFQYPIRADQVKKARADEFGLYPVKGIERVGKDFKKKLVDISNYIGINPNWLATVISFESGFDPRIVNKQSGATGLIQWVPYVAESMYGIPKEKASDVIRSKSAMEQLDMVKRFFEPHKGKLKSLDDVYLAVFMPALIGQKPSKIVARKGSKVYEQNSGFDKDKKGYYTVGDITSKIRKHQGTAISAVPKKKKQTGFWEDFEEFGKEALDRFMRFLQS